MEPIILLFLSDRLLRLEIKKKLEPEAEVQGGTTLEDLITEVKWTNVSAVLLDMTDNKIDGYGMLEYINTTYPSVPVVCLVNNQSDADEYKNQSDKNIIYRGDFEAGAIADELLNILPAGEAGKKSTNARTAFATQMRRLQENLRRLGDYAWGEATDVVKEEEIPWEEVEWLKTFNGGLEGFLQIQMENREEK